MNLFNVYPLYNVKPTHAKMCYVYDENGNKYLDLYGGHAVISIGHSHPNYIKNITSQLNKISFYSNYIINDLQLKLIKNEAISKLLFQFNIENIGSITNSDSYELGALRFNMEANYQRKYMYKKWKSSL